MKHTFINRCAAVLCLLLASNLMYAHDFYLDGIYYNITDSVEKTVAVTHHDGIEVICYKGNVIIPHTVEYNDDTYSVTSIGFSAFGGCKDLISVIIPESVTSIDTNAFYNCVNLTSVTIPGSVTTISYSAFYGCTGLTSVIISEGVNYIYSEAFGYCSSLAEIKIPGSVKRLGLPGTGDKPFVGCSNLSFIEVAESNTVYDSRNNCNAIIETATNTLIQGSNNTIIPDDIIEIRHSAFSNCTGLTSITIPKNVTLIGNAVFSGCTELTSLTVADGNAIYDSRDNCNAIIETATNTLIQGCKNTSIPESIVSIDYHAFEDCTGLTSVVIPQSVTSIGDRTFAGCTGLTLITCKATTPPTIAGSAFNGVDKTTPLNVPEESIEAYRTAENWCDFSNIYSGDVCFPANSEFEADGIYYRVTKINSEVVVIKNNLSEESCYTGDVVIPATVTKEGITFNVTKITDRAFKDCTDLTSVVISEGITSIGNFAFDGCTSLTSVTIPNGVNAIGAYTFYGCTGLTTVVVPESITSIGNNAFTGCTGLTTITIPKNVTSIGHGAFANCSGLTSITIPDKVSSISGSAFSGCVGLSSVTIPDSVASIGDFAFCGCTGLTSIIIPENITLIGEAVFAECTSLTSIVIPDKVTSIGENAFYNCAGLSSVTIPSNVTLIGDFAFYDCCNLTSVTCEAAFPPTIGDAVFLNIDTSIPLYVPDGCVELYRADEYWCAFENIKAVTTENRFATDAIEVVAIDDTIRLDEILLPVSLLNTPEIAGFQCDIFLPEGVEAVKENDIYAITLSSRANGFSVSSHMRNDGALRVIVTTFSLTPISGNEGEIFTLKLQPNEQYTAGSHIEIRNIVMTSSDYIEYESSPLVIPCHIKESLSGDTNRDKKINVTDVAHMACYLQGDYSGEFDTDAGDRNQDGNIDTADITIVSDDIVSGERMATANNTDVTAYTESYLVADSVVVVELDGVIGEQTVSIPISMVNTQAITAVQCDVVLPAGVVLSDADNAVTLSTRCSADHVLKTNTISNGTWRIVIYSTTATAIEGNEGELFSLKLQPTEDYLAGNTIEVRNITLATTDAQEINAMPVDIKCCIKESSLGDVNGDNKKNISDIIISIGIILDNYDKEYDAVAADVCGDGALNISDVISLINLILTDGDTPAETRQRQEYAIGQLLASPLQIEPTGKQSLTVSLDNEAPYTAFQVDVILPDGLTVDDVTLCSRLADSHDVMWHKVSDGLVRIVAFSLNNAPISGNVGDLFSLAISAENQFVDGKIELTQALFATRNIVEHTISDVVIMVKSPTDLASAEQAESIYTTGNILVVESDKHQSAYITSANGITQTVDLQAGHNEITLSQQGVYIVTTESRIKKVIIK